MLPKCTLKIIVSLALTLAPGISNGQANGPQFTSLRKNVATVMFAGLGGAVLGLSTLSFYGEPQEHINNIWIGLALGLVGGAGFVAIKSGQNYSTQLEWERLNKTRNAKTYVPLAFGYSWDF